MRFTTAFILTSLAFATACTPNGGLPSDRISANALTTTENGSAVVQKGDTLYAISQRFNVPLSQLAQTNNMSVSAPLHAGQLLHLPESPATEQAATYTSDTVSASASGVAPIDSEPASLAPGAAPQSAVTSQPLDNSPDYKLQQMGPSGQPLAVTPANIPPVNTAQPQAVTANAPPTLIEAQNPTAAPLPLAVTPAPASQPASAATSPASAAIAPATTAAGSTVAQSGAAATAAGAAPSFQWPVSGRVTSGFGKKPDGASNDGIDIQAPPGTQVSAAAPGVVLYTGDTLKEFGNLVLVRHQGGYVTAYAHLDHVLVDKDAVVAAGDPIGTVGTSGGIKSPSLHFEIRQGDTALDPRKLLQQAAN